MAENEKGIFDAILQGEIDFASAPWPTISESAKDLVRKMLTQDPRKRITPAQVLGINQPLQYLCLRKFFGFTFGSPLGFLQCCCQKIYFVLYIEVSFSKCVLFGLKIIYKQEEGIKQLPFFLLAVSQSCHIQNLEILYFNLGK